MLEPKTELAYKCFTEQIRENYQKVSAVYFSSSEVSRPRKELSHLEMLVRRPERKLRRKLEV